MSKTYHRFKHCIVGTLQLSNSNCNGKCPPGPLSIVRDDCLEKAPFFQMDFEIRSNFERFCVYTMLESVIVPWHTCRSFMHFWRKIGTVHQELTVCWRTNNVFLIFCCTATEDTSSPSSFSYNLRLCVMLPARNLARLSSLLANKQTRALALGQYIHRESYLYSFGGVRTTIFFICLLALLLHRHTRDLLLL